jgi:cytochrome b
MDDRLPDAATATRVIRVWDVPVRLVHWTQVALVATNVVTGFTGGSLLRVHRLSGYAILTLLLFRLAWGFAGGGHARFASWIQGPRAIAAFLRETLALRRPFHVGHNPLAGWMALALLASLVVQASTGLFANDDIFFEGPLASAVSKSVSDTLTGVHKTNARILIALVALHVGAVVLHLVIERQDHLTPMFTGRKRLPAGIPAPAPARARNPALALVLFLAACAAVALVVNAPGLGRTGEGP